ncbi:hypothetical protein T492DRAFT_1091665 [Pavlovales sp. CCMP2436]|nr:hypothetical protein T492DRAFT_1091665 [Pavlovales sp. CCMP2436]
MLTCQNCRAALQAASSGKTLSMMPARLAGSGFRYNHGGAACTGVSAGVSVPGVSAGARCKCSPRLRPKFCTRWPTTTDDSMSVQCSAHQRGLPACPTRFGGPRAPAMHVPRPLGAPPSRPRAPDKVGPELQSAPSRTLRRGVRSGRSSSRH